MKRLADKISDKKYDHYADVISWIRSNVSFTLLRSCLLYLKTCRAIEKSSPLAVDISIAHQLKKEGCA